MGCLGFIAFIHVVAQGVDAHVQLKAYQQYERIKIDQQHEDQNRTDGAIEFIVIGKIAYIKGEAAGKNDHQERGED